MKLRGFCSALVLVLGCLGPGRTVRAADLRNVLIDHTLTTWTTDDGLPSGVLWALAQDRNGDLWVGTDTGLTQFNGARFVPWDMGDPPDARRPVRVLTVTRDGALWVGFGRSGGAIRMRDGQTTRFGTAEGLPASTITALVEDAAGTVWAGTEVGLFSLARERWSQWPAGQGLPETAVSGAFVDTQDNFYVGTATGVFRRARGARFEQIEYSSGAMYRPAGRGPRAGDHAARETAAERDPATARSFPRSFVQDEGHVLVNDWQMGFRIAGVPQEPLDSSVRGRGTRLLIDRRHSLWIATAGQGLWRVSLSSEARVVSAERMTALTGLVNDGVTALLEDSEGNIWAGVQEGLVRLTPRRIRQLTDYGLVIGTELTPDRSVWVGTLDELIRFSPERPESPSARVSLGNATLRVMHAGREGTLWVATDHGLSMMRPGSLALTPVPNTGTLEQIELITSDDQGGLWIYDSDHRLTHWSRGVLSEFALPDALQAPGFVLLHADREGRLWVALSDGRIAVIDGKNTSVYGAGEGLNVGTIRQVLEDDDGGVWLAGSEGLAKSLHGGFTSLRSGQGFPFGDLVALAEDDVHDLWIGTGSGVMRISRDDFASVTAHKSQQLRYSLYNSQNGLAGHPHAYDSNRRVVRAADGRLWFVTARGVSLIDPPLLREGRTPAHVRIDYALVNEQRMDVAPGVSLPSRTSRLGIAYSQLNLSSPLRVRFRTKLEGFDNDWVPAGTRLTAFYTNLPPKNYRFRVSAVSPDGTGAEPEAVWDFSIEPMFYQTAWFSICSVLVVVAGLAGVWRLRLHQVRRQFSSIIGERVRLSRELHDTLLQNLVAIALQFDAVAADDTSPDTRKRLVLARKQVEENIREARQMIFDLRSSQNHRRDLVTALRALGEHATADRRIEFELLVTGEVRPCPPRVRDELLRIGQEAVANAVRHARASHIRMTLDFGPSDITLKVSDDGCGFDSGAPLNLESGHYGLTGMRERAQQIGAVLEVSSELHKGTYIRAVVPLAA